MVELEKTYLAKFLPPDYESSPFKEIIDIYYPKAERHPVLRLRKIGERCEMTKKTPVAGADASQQIESTISLSSAEYDELSKLEGKESVKTRYYYKVGEETAEITIFEKKLKGLVLIDFEFQSMQAMDVFQAPDFCLADVTEEEFAAGGMIAGMSYSEIEPQLEKFGYKKI